MTNAKVKVSKEVAEAVEFQLTKRSSEELLKRKAKHDAGHGWFINRSAVLNELSFDQLAQALYVGYEVKKSPKEELASIYKYYKFEAYTTDMTAYADGIERAVSILGLKIEGVNV